MEFPIALFTSASTIYAFYPYRDFVKFYPTSVDANFFVSRYRGLATNPAQLGLLALPNAYMLGVGGRGDGGSLVTASICAGFMRRFIRTLIFRMGEKTGSSRAGMSVYANNWDAMAKATASYGVMSWFVGGTAASLMQLLTTGLAIRSVGGTAAPSSRRGRNKRAQTDASILFLYDWWYFFRAHAFFTTVTAPLRNALATAMHIPQRGHGQVTAASWAQSELHIYKEAALISKRMMSDMGIRYFFQGTIRSVLKVSLPMGFNFAMYKGLVEWTGIQNAY